MSDPERTIPVDRELFYEVIGFLEGVEKADGKPLRERAGWWAGHFARRLRASDLVRNAETR